MSQPPTPRPDPAPEGDAPTLTSGDRLPNPASRLAALAEGEEDTALSKRRVLGDRYEVRGELARGGMGRVLVARDRRLGREVAIKELLEPDPEARERFEREVQVTARLQHPSIVTVHEVGVGPEGEPYYVMPQVPGRSLHEAIARLPSPAERLALLPQVIAACEALAYAHENGVIHRDLKPANLLVGAFGETVVIDWGLAKVLGQAEAPAKGGPASSGPALTVVGQVMGTPAYMAPEQARGTPLDPRCDVYALGAILWHLLTGAPPYPGADARSTLAAVLAGPPPEPDWAGAPAELVDVVRRAMAHDPAARYPSAAALVADLRRFQAGQRVAAHRYSRLELAARWVQRHRAPVAVAGVALLALVAVGLVSLARVLEARRVAEQQREAATQARDRAQQLQHQAELDRQRALLREARAQLGADPTEALVQLRGLAPGLPGWAEARQLAEEALAAGVAGWELALPGPVAVAVLHDGRRLALGTRDGQVLLWDARDGRARRLGAHPARVLDLTPSDDDARLISTAEDGSARVWDLASGAALPLSERGEPAWGSAFLADGTVALLRTDTTDLWDPATGKELARLAGYRASVVVNSPHAHALLLRRDDQAELVTGAGPPRRFPLGEDWHFVSIGKDARQLLASSLAGGLALFDTRTGAARQLGGLPGTAPDEHTLLDSGAVLALLDSRSYALWRPGDRAPTLGRVDCEARRVHPLAGDRAVFFCESAVELLDLASGARRVVALRDGPEAVIGVGGQLLASQRDGLLRVWDLAADPAPEVELEGPVDGLAAAPDGRRILAVLAGAAPRLEEVALPRGPARTLARPAGPLRAWAASPDLARLAWAAADGLAWEQVASGEVHRLDEPGALALQFSRDGAALLASTATGVTVFELASGAATRVPTGEPAFVAAGPDRRWLVTADLAGQRLTCWGLDGRPLHELGRSERLVALSEDGRWLLNGRATGELEVWDTRSWTSRVLRGAGRGLQRLALLPDASAAALLDDEGRLRLRPLDGGPERDLARLPSDVSVLWPARDSRRVAAVTNRGDVVLTDLASGVTWPLRDPRGPFDDVDDAGGAWVTARRSQLRSWRDDLPAEPEALLAALRARPRPARLEP